MLIGSSGVAMLSLPRISTAIMQRSLHTSAPYASGHSVERWYNPERRAGREVVGTGFAGSQELYSDRIDFWYPAIRFRNEDDTIKAIRKKELGSWKSLSKDEKKQLYRFSFRQTYAEFRAPHGYWKVIAACVLGCVSCTVMFSVFLNLFVYVPLGPVFSNEYRESQLERHLVFTKGLPIKPATQYDYDRKVWIG